MLITGLQTLTLLDFPGKVACTVFLGGCNFRCPWCHNSEFLENPRAVMTEQELLRFLESRRGLLEGVCVSGGEPTLQPGLPALLRNIKALGYAVKLDTNGSRPEVLAELLEEKLVDYVAMDVKNSMPRYAPTAGLVRLELQAIRESLTLLLDGDTDYELRTTVVKPFHDVKSMEAVALTLELLSENKAKRFFLQPFVDRETVLFGGFSAPDAAELAAMKAALEPACESVEIRGID